MKKRILYILMLSILWSGTYAQPRRLFDNEQREGDSRPKPDLTPCSPSPMGKGPRVGSKAKAGLSAAASAKAGWQPNGIVVCDTSWAWLPKIVSDGNSGAIICWTERYRGEDTINNATWDIYAQRVDSGGNFVWQRHGVPVCSLSGSNSTYPAMVSDGRGGSIIAWEDDRDGLYYTRVFAQRLDSLGNRLWPENGVLVCNQMSGYVDICSDGHGGAIIAYVDGRDEATTSDNIYAQRIDSAGNPVWQIDGVPVCTAESIQFWPGICSNNYGGAVITWWDDYRNGSTEMDAYGQLINCNGDMKWTVNGELLSSKFGNQKSYDPISTDDGGALIGWADYTTPYTYMQRIDSIGTKLWSDTGVVVGRYGKFHIDGRGGVIGSNQDTVNRIDSLGNICWGSGVALHDTLPSGGENDADADGFGGVVAIWNYSTHLYAQRVDSSGVVLWESIGVPVCTTMNTSTYQQVIGDGIGGAITTWFGLYPGSMYYTYPDIMVQRIYTDGTPGGITGYPGEVMPYNDIFLNAYPNPFNPLINIQYALCKTQQVSLIIYNITGQKVKTLVRSRQKAGQYGFRWHGDSDQGNKISKGVYFVCLTADDKKYTKKITIIK